MAETWVGFGDYIPSDDTTRTLLFLKPDFVALRFGRDVLFEPSFGIAYNYHPQVGMDSSRFKFRIGIRAIKPIFNLGSSEIYLIGGGGFYYDNSVKTYLKDENNRRRGDYDGIRIISWSVPLGVGLIFPVFKKVYLSFDIHSGFEYNVTTKTEYHDGVITNTVLSSDFGVFAESNYVRAILFFSLE